MLGAATGLLPQGALAWVENSASGFKPSFETPFDAQSLWNARPVQAVLGGGQIRVASNAPWINDTKYGIAIYRVSPSDGPADVAISNVGDENWGTPRAITFPHWPSSVVPPHGTDAAVTIYDPTTGLLYDFWQLSKSSGSWAASAFMCTPISGSGWGTPDHPAVGIRAAGASSLGGLLRSREKDTLTIKHALALSLDASALINGPVFPATLEDYGARYTGVTPNAFPMGTLLMLPGDFDVTSLSSATARAIAQAFTDYGGYVIDNSTKTFAIVGEVGSGWLAATPQSDLAIIETALRPVISTAGWLDANDKPFRPRPFSAMNLLGMHGPWQVQSGPRHPGYYDTTRDAFVVPSAPGQSWSARAVIYKAVAPAHGLWNWKGRSAWYPPGPVRGQRYTWNVKASPGLTGWLDVKKGDWSATLYNGGSGTGLDGTSDNFTWTDGDAGTVTEVWVGGDATSTGIVKVALQ